MDMNLDEESFPCKVGMCEDGVINLWGSGMHCIVSASIGVWVVIFLF